MSKYGEFEVGDQVTVIGDEGGSGYCDYFLGRNGKISDVNHDVEYPFNVEFGTEVGDSGAFKENELAHLEVVHDIEVGDMVVIKADLREGVTLTNLDGVLSVENIWPIRYAGERVFEVEGNNGWRTNVPESWVEKYVEPEPTLRSELQQHLTNVQGWVKEYSDYRDLYAEGKTDAYKVVAARVMGLLERFAE